MAKEAGRANVQTYGSSDNEQTPLISDTKDNGGFDFDKTDKSNTLTWTQKIELEKRTIQKRRLARVADQPPQSEEKKKDPRFSGIGFSGGGIRSGAFQAGVLNGLAKIREKQSVLRLGDIDYISCVSGGGYTGSGFITRFNENTNLSDENLIRLADDTRIQMITNVPYMNLIKFYLYFFFSGFVEMTAVFAAAIIWSPLLSALTMGDRQDEWCNGEVTDLHVFPIIRIFLFDYIFTSTAGAILIGFIFLATLICSLIYLFTAQVQRTVPKKNLIFPPKQKSWWIYIKMTGSLLAIIFFLYYLFETSNLIAYYFVTPKDKRTNEMEIWTVCILVYLIICIGASLEMVGMEGAGLGFAANIGISIIGFGVFLMLALIAGASNLQDNCRNYTCPAGINCRPFEFMLSEKFTWQHFQILIWIFSFLMWLLKQYKHDTTPVSLYYRRSLKKTFYNEGVDIPIHKIDSSKAPYLIMNGTASVSHTLEDTNTEEGWKKSEKLGFPEGELLRPYTPFEMTKDGIGSCELGYRTFAYCEKHPSLLWIGYGLWLSDAMGISGAAVSANLGDLLLTWVGNLLIGIFGFDMGSWIPFTALSNPFRRNFVLCFFTYILPILFHLFGLIFRQLWLFFIPFILANLMFLVTLISSRLYQVEPKDGCCASLLDLLLPNWMLRALFICFGGSKQTKQPANSYIYVSDGGHFENLGVYALLKRKCKTIYAFDAGADLTHTLDGIKNLLELALQDDLISDFQYEEAIDKHHGIKGLALHTGSPLKMSNSRVVRIDVTYFSESQEKLKGNIWYVKSTLTGKETDQSLHLYTLNSPTFPNDSTANQYLGINAVSMYSKLGIASIDDLNDRISEYEERLKKKKQEENL